MTKRVGAARAWIAALVLGGVLLQPVAAQEYRLSDRTDAAALMAADQQLQAGQFGEAMRGYRVLLDAAGDGPDALVIAVRFGIAANRAGDYQAAYHVLSRQIASPGWQRQDPELMDRALEEGIDAASQARGPKEALAFAQRLVDLRREHQGAQAPATQAARLTVSAMLDQPETYEEAKRIRDEALGILKRGDSDLYVRILNNVVEVTQQKGRLDSAADLYDLLLAEMRSRPESVELGFVELNKAMLDRSRYEIASAIEHHLRAIDILERLDGRSTANTIAAIGALGTTYAHAGRPAAALPLMRDAYERAASGLGETADTMNMAANLTDVLRALNRHAEAEPLDRIVLKWFEENVGPTSQEALTARQKLAYDFVGLGKPLDAKRELDEVMARLRQSRGDDDPMTQDFKRNADLIAVLTGMAAPSDMQFAALLDDAPSTGENMLLANRLAGIADKKGDKAAEMRLHRLALRIAQDLYGELHQQSLTMLANVARAERENDAPETTATYAELEQRMRLWSRREYASTQDEAALEQVAQWTRESIGDILAYSFQAARSDPKAQQLFAAVLAEWKAVGSLERAVLDAAAEALPEADKALLAKVRALRVKSLAQPRNGAGMGDVERELAIAEAALSERVSGLRQSGDTDSYAAVIARLSPDQAIVDYMIAPVKMETGVVERVFAMVSRAGGKVWLFDLGTLEEVAGPLVGSASGYDPAVRPALHDTLIAKLEPKLDGVARLYVVPDGILNLAPFDGLLDADGRNLIERRDVRIARNARAVSGGRDRAVEPGGALLVGAVDYGEGEPFKTLPATGVEIERIAGTLGGQSFAATEVEGKAAGEPAVRAAASGKRILHFATHGFFNPVSESETAPLWRAGIALAGANAAAVSDDPGDDGILHAAELTAWPLAGVELVVLSACDTAQGDRSYVEGLSGLPSALAAAGAKRSLLARWPVDDRGAANFMTRFYENLVAKRGYAAAIRQTKLDAVAGKIDGVTEATWMAFALIENESSAPADVGQPPVEEATVHEKAAEPATPADAGACGPADRGAVPC